MAVDVLVTGGYGVLGHRIVDSLRSTGHRVVACGRVGGVGVDAQWDISQQDRPDPDCEPAAVVHSAARIGSYQHPFSESTALFDVNVTGSLRVARWCIARQVQRLILISSAIVYGEWTDSPKGEKALVKPWIAGAYAVSKWCSEQVASLVKGAGIKLTILRLSSLYGTDYERGLVQRLLQQGRETGDIHLRPPLDDAFDLLYVSDAACTVGRALQSEREGLWNVGSGSLTTIGELAELCSKHVGARVTHSGDASDRPPRIINWVRDERARLELGHINQVSVDAGIAAIASSYDAAGG